MFSPEGLITAFKRNAAYIHESLDGLNHADAVVQPPAQGNCILWIMGHIVCYRNYALHILGQPLALPEEQALRFAFQSEPVLEDSPDLPRLEALLAAYDASQEVIFAALRALSLEAAAEVITYVGQTMERANLVMSLMRHEAYHAGQLEWLRQWALQQRH